MAALLMVGSLVGGSLVGGSLVGGSLVANLSVAGSLQVPFVAGESVTHLSAASFGGPEV